jgi:hypothetical protein
MSNADPRLATAIDAIDAANARDPNQVEVDGRTAPGELVYGQRMSATLARLDPAASVHLQIAARGQHIERWTSPRKSYPDGRAGYLKWRTDLKDFHANRVGEIMAGAGFSPEDIARVGSLIRKERLKRDGEAQMLEDVVCVVFLQHYIDGFMAKTDQAKLPDILAKTWAKMSPLGHEHALKLALDPSIPRLLEQGLRQRDKA